MPVLRHLTLVTRGHQVQSGAEPAWEFYHSFIYMQKTARYLLLADFAPNVRSFDACCTDRPNDHHALSELPSDTGRRDLVRRYHNYFLQAHQYKAATSIAKRCTLHSLFIRKLECDRTPIHTLFSATWWTFSTKYRRPTWKFYRSLACKNCMRGQPAATSCVVGNVAQDFCLNTILINAWTRQVMRDRLIYKSVIISFEKTKILSTRRDFYFVNSITLSSLDCK